MSTKSDISDEQGYMRAQFCLTPIEAQSGQKNFFRQKKFRSYLRAHTVNSITTITSICPVVIVIISVVLVYIHRRP